jgi:hypothetical protein
MPTDRASRYARISRAKKEKGPRDALIIAHVTRTPKRKIRLHHAGIVIGSSKEVPVNNEKLSETEPRYVFESDYGVRKMAHDIVRKSGRYSKFYDTIVKVVYDGDEFGQKL